jgi:kynureninase
LELDRQDPLADFRHRFHFPQGAIYLDGNSLGLLSRDAESAITRVIDQWRDHAINGYRLPRPDSWFSMGEELGALTAPLIGAFADEVVVTGTTTVNLHQLMATMYRPAGHRRKIVATSLDFPTDVYAIQSQIRLFGGDPSRDLILVPSRDGRTIAESDLIDAMTEEISLVLIPAVLYRSGQLLDIATVAGAARARDIIIGVDAAHSAGAVPHEFHRDGCDFAVWCGYKYLNAGPGAVAGLFVHRRHHGLMPGLAGWWGHDKATQFDMAHDFRPAADAGAFQISSNPQLSAAPLRASLEMFREAGIDRIREKSLQLTAFLMELVDALAPHGYRIGTPREAHRRGGHVAIEHATEADRICKSLKEDLNIVPDFRMPNVIRLAPVALYNSFHDVWQAARALLKIMESSLYSKHPKGRGLIA